MEKETVLAAIDHAFGSLPRPQIMLNDPTHCEECEDHESVMQSVTPGTVSRNEIGNPGWDPICYVSDETYAYFMPAFVRLALDESDHYAYLDQLFFHLGHTDRIAAMTPEQRRAVRLLIDYIGDTLLDFIVNNCLEIDFDHVNANLAASSE